MLTCYLQGGLGNQLFQIFTTLSYALTHKKPFAFTNKAKIDRGTIRSTYWHSFLSPLAKFTKDIDYYKLNAIVIKEKKFAYNELPSPPANINNINANANANIILDGYFQSYKYFETHYKNIIKLIKLEEQRENVRLKYTIKYPLLSNTISLHIRQGDYKYVQNYHPLMTYDYYHDALTYIQTNKKEISTINVLIFCEKNDLTSILPMLERLRQSFPTLTFQIVDFTIPDWEQLLLMSLCQHNIIANSSFSWWGAYFNANPGKIVCYPSNWFGPAMQEHDTHNLFEKGWTKINLKST